MCSVKLNTCIAALLPHCGPAQVLQPSMRVRIYFASITHSIEHVSSICCLHCRAMLTYASGTSVTKNAAEKKINSLMDYMGGCEDAALLQRFYTTTLESDEGSSNERLWFQAKLKLCELWFGTGQFGPLAPVLAELADVRCRHLGQCVLSASTLRPCARRTLQLQCWQQ